MRFHFLLFFLILTQFSESYANEPKFRIVALMPHVAETLYQFGVGSEIVGVPEFTDVPNQYSKQIKRIGAYHKVSVEAVVALKPTIVFASMDGNVAETVAKLKQLGLQVRVFDPRTLAGIENTLNELAEVAAAVEPRFNEANRKLIENFIGDLKKLKGKLKPLKTFVQVGFDPLVSVSNRSFLGELLTHLGLENIYKKEKLPYPRPVFEDVLARNPEVVLIINLSKSPSETERERKVWQRFSNVAAVRNNKIIQIQGDRIAKPGLGLTGGLMEIVQKVEGQANESH